MSILKRLNMKTGMSFGAISLAPEAPFWAIGDVHGRHDLLVPILADLIATSEPVILVGDYVNKGPDSAATLRLLQDATASNQVIALRGNHEELLLRFLKRPRKHGNAWLQYGGQQTLESFGITGLPSAPSPRELLYARSALVDAMGDLVAWLESRPFIWQSGNVAVMHAGADPAQPLDDQPEKAFAWGHPDFERKVRNDSTWIVHGHRQVTKVQIKMGRIAIDTGAYATNKLSAVRFSKGAIETR